MDLLAILDAVDAEIAMARAADPDYDAKIAADMAARSNVKGSAPSSVACGKCGGNGRVWEYRHVCDGRCFDCQGTGRR